MERAQYTLLLRRRSSMKYPGATDKNLRSERAKLFVGRCVIRAARSSSFSSVSSSSSFSSSSFTAVVRDPAKRNPNVEEESMDRGVRLVH